MGRRRSLKIRRQRGQGMVEYALIIGLIAVLVMIVLALLGTQLASVYCGVVGFFRGTGSQCRSESSSPLLQDQFDNLTGWTFTAGKNWQIKDGKLTVTPGGEDHGFTGNSGWTDYTVQVEKANLQQGNGYGVYFRASSEPKVNGYVFQYDPGYGKFIIRKVVDGNESPPIAMASPPAQFQWTNVPRAISIDVRGSTFTASIDGTRILQGQDTQFTSGKVGLRSWDDTHASFDSITVSP